MIDFLIDMVEITAIMYIISAIIWTLFKGDHIFESTLEVKEVDDEDSEDGKVRHIKRRTSISLSPPRFVDWLKKKSK